MVVAIKKKKQRGGLKHKIDIQPITVKTSLGPTCNKRREGLFSKASQLCLLSGGQIAVLATPLSSGSLHSFGHSSVDNVVQAFLSGRRPHPVPDDHKQQMRTTTEDEMKLGLGFWWNDETLLSSDDPKLISDAIHSMRTLLEELRAQEAASNYETQEEPDHLLPSSPICCIPHDPDEDLVDDLPEGLHEITEEQILSLCSSFNNTNTNTNTNNSSFTQEEEPQVNNFDDFDEWDIDQFVDFDY